MLTGSSAVARNGGSGSRQHDTRHAAWLLAAPLFAMASLATVYLFRDTWETLLQTWLHIDTYKYGLFVPFISAALIIRLRHRLLVLTPLPAAWGIAGVALLSTAWMAGEVSGVLAIQQFAALAMIPAIALAIFGWEVMRVMGFPVLFLLFALPAGEFLIPKLITWTADFSVASLEFLGIPVFRDGPYIRIPAGDFHVVKACSGIRYLLTSIVLGTLFAYLCFRSWYRRAALLLVSVFVPLVANWVRATCIVLIGHLSDMRLAAGIDHFIYGWLFFGLVMLVIFLIGSRFSDGDPAAVFAAPRSGEPVREPVRADVVLPVAVFFGVILAAPLGVGLSGLISDRATAAEAGQRRHVLPKANSGWVRREPVSRDWNPVFVGASSLRQGEYHRGDEVVSVAAVYYDRQTQGAELVNVGNSLYEPVRWWPTSDRKMIHSDGISGVDLPLREVSVNDGRHSRLIWTWYSISGYEAANEFLAKLASFRSLLANGEQGAFQVALAVDYDEDIAAGRQALTRFLNAHLERFRQCLDTVADDRDGSCE